MKTKIKLDSTSIIGCVTRGEVCGGTEKNVSGSIGKWGELSLKWNR